MGQLLSVYEGRVRKGAAKGFGQNRRTNDPVPAAVPRKVATLAWMERCQPFPEFLQGFWPWQNPPYWRHPKRSCDYRAEKQLPLAEKIFRFFLIRIKTRSGALPPRADQKLARSAFGRLGLTGCPKRTHQGSVSGRCGAMLGATWTFWGKANPQRPVSWS